jgi:hypothetical protein
MINPKLITIFILVQKFINFFFSLWVSKMKERLVGYWWRREKFIVLPCLSHKRNRYWCQWIPFDERIFLRCFENLNLLEKVDCSREKKKWFDFMFFDQFRYMFVEILVYFLFLWCFLSVLCQNRLKIEFWIKKHPTLIFQPSQVVEIWINRQHFICIVFK